MKIIKLLPLFVVLTLVGVVSFAATAHAADTMTSSTDSSLLELLKPVYDAFAGGHYAFAVPSLVIAAVALLKRYAGSGKFGAFVHGNAGGSLLALATAVPQARWLRRSAPRAGTSASPCSRARCSSDSAPRAGTRC
jgi:hypothetical protein